MNIGSLADQLSKSPNQIRFRQGTIVSVEADQATLTVTIAGSTVPISGVRYATGVMPAPGLAVWLATDGTDMFAIATLMTTDTVAWGNWVDYTFCRSSSQPATPTGDSPGSPWSSSPPTGTDPLWMSEATKNAEGTVLGSWSYPVRLTGDAGATGATGATGAAGSAGAPAPLVQVQYSQNGTSWYTTPTGSDVYLRMSNDGGTTWGSSVRILGPQGPTGAQGATGATGPQGATGANGYSNAVVYLFQRATSAPAVPSGTATYTFATGAATGIGSWSQSVPAGTDPVYVTVSSASGTGATDTIATNEWAAPVVLAQNGAAGATGATGPQGATGATGSAGAPGMNVATVFLYQRSASGAPAVPSGAVTYTFATSVASGIGSWTQSVPAGTDPIYVTTATAASTGSSDTIATGEWAAPAVLAQNGAAGATGATGPQGATGATGNYITTVYIASATQPSTPTGNGPVPSGWSQTPIDPGDGKTLWVSTATCKGDNTLVSGWSTPVQYVFRAQYIVAGVALSSPVISAGTITGATYKTADTGARIVITGGVVGNYAASSVAYWPDSTTPFPGALQFSALNDLGLRHYATLQTATDASHTAAIFSLVGDMRSGGTPSAALNCPIFINGGISCTPRRVVLYSNATGIASGALPTFAESIYDFSYLIIKVAVADTRLTAPISPYSDTAAVRAYAVHDTGTNTVTFTAAFTASADGLTLTLVSATQMTHTASGSHSARSTINVTEVIGVY